MINMRAKLLSRSFIPVTLIGIAILIAIVVKPLNLTNSSYDKCINQCMEGHTQTIKMCKSDIQDYIENYDTYYSPYGVSSAFATKYANKLHPEKTAYKVICFREVVGCRETTCKDYIGK